MQKTWKIRNNPVQPKNKKKFSVQIQLTPLSEPKEKEYSSLIQIQDKKPVKFKIWKKLQCDLKSGKILFNSNSENSCLSKSQMYLYRTMISIKAGLELLSLSFISFIFIFIVIILIIIIIIISSSSSSWSI